MNTIKKITLLVILISLMAGITSPITAEDACVIKAVKIYTAVGEVINNGMIFIKNGKIYRVGKDFTIPKNTEVIKAEIVS